jgi:hypothetical protein
MSDFDFIVRKGDTSGSISADLEDAAGDLDSAAVTFSMWATDGTAIASGAATLDSSDPEYPNTYVYSWQAGDTDTAGVFLAEFSATYEDGSVQTFPNVEPLVVRVSDPAVEPIDLLRAQIETDLSDVELFALIERARADVAARLGPEPDEDGFVEQTIIAPRAGVLTLRQIASTETADLADAEVTTRPFLGSSEPTTLDASEWTLTGGRYLARAGRARPWSEVVTIKYKPAADVGDQRRAAIVALAALDASSDPGLTRRSAGDTSLELRDYYEQRAKLLNNVGNPLGFA